MNTTGNKSIENTLMKRKRMLYNTTTFSDPEVFSSEVSIFDLEQMLLKLD